MTDELTIEVYNNQTKAYTELEGGLTPDDFLQDFLSRLSDGDRVLDLGCGPARSSRIMRNYGLKVDAVDASAQMVAVAKSKYGIDVRQAYFEEIEAVSVYAGIWASFSLLHASADEFNSILNKLHKALRPRGIFHIGMKLGSGSSRDKLGRLYSFYSEDELRERLNKAGFSILEIHHGEGKGLAGTIDPWIRVSSQK